MREAWLEDPGDLRFIKILTNADLLRSIWFPSEVQRIESTSRRDYATCVLNVSTFFIADKTDRF